ncbi:hypothetical protein MK805_05670 [Shimazuella sp. AN120528]|uniref:hypothetical protein n=1 Tax=Shimazuella soli TaxID=1892854 RepID=UPI001F0DFFD3|nr:hypothetical protein [Shimazuella soli]MCH5584455.1 hypothetical protein [Shimazuella soli]
MAINMTKGKTVNLSKPVGVPDGLIKLHLDWEVGRDENDNPVDVDVDLGLLYELKDGTKGVVQALGNSFGRLDGPPWFKLNGDDQTGATSGEIISAFYSHAEEDVERAGVFAYVYRGAHSLKAAKNARTTIYVPGLEERVIWHGEHNTRYCAIALLTNTGTGFDVRMDVKPISGGIIRSGHRKIDRHWGWGMNWTPGRK